MGDPDEGAGPGDPERGRLGVQDEGQHCGLDCGLDWALDWGFALGV
jgi:hypothetical protein